MLTRFRNIAYVLAYAVATIPLWHYIRDGRILALMVAIVTFAYINVVLSTVHAAQPILSSEKAKSPLPRWLPDKPKYQKWWLLVRRTLKWHLLLIPPKMGLALGFVEFLTTLSYPFRYPAGNYLRLYSYAGNARDHFYFLNRPTPYPQLETILLGCLVIVLFSLAAQGLLCAITLSTKQNFVNVVAKKIVIIFVVIGATTILETPIAQYERTRLRLLGTLSTTTVYSTTNTIVEQGILLGANIMRPLWGGTGGGPDNPTGRWDNRGFVIEQLGVGILGLLLYASTTWVILWFVEDENHAE
jgi:hypothetical protein